MFSMACNDEAVCWGSFLRKRQRCNRGSMATMWKTTRGVWGLTPEKAATQLRRKNSRLA